MFDNCPLWCLSPSIGSVLYTAPNLRDRAIRLVIIRVGGDVSVSYTAACPLRDSVIGYKTVCVLYEAAM